MFVLSKCFFCFLFFVGIAPDVFGDIVFMLDKSAALGQGHIAVMIGCEAFGWHYVSINGTAGGSKPWGVNINADTGIFIIDTSGAKISNVRRAVRRACEINPLEKHNYILFRRLRASRSEDSEILSAIKKTASSVLYGIIGPGSSCIDVAQTAFSKLVKIRKLDKNGSVPGQSDLIPKNWFRKIDNRVKIVNRRSENRRNIIKFYHKTNKRGRIYKVSIKKLTGRKPSLHEIIADFGFFIQPSKKFSAP